MLQKTPTPPFQQPSPLYKKRPNAKVEDDSMAIANLAPSDPSSSDVMGTDDLVRIASTSADELMDAVFEEVDYMLEKGGSLVPTSPLTSSDHKGIMHLEASQSTSTEMAPAASRSHLSHPLSETPSADIALSSPFPVDSLPESSIEAMIDPLIESSIKTSSPEINQHQWQQAFSIAFPILGACATLGVALAAGLILYGPSSIWGGRANQVTIKSADLPPHANFADYMERALEAIAFTKDSERLASAGSNESSPNFPSAPNSLSSDSDRSSGIPERVYIPVYQPPQPSLTALPTIPVDGTLSTPSPSSLGNGATVSQSTTVTPPTVVQPDSQSAATSTTSQSTATSQSSSEIVSPSTTASDNGANEGTGTNTSSGSSQSPIFSELSHNHVLVGLLQLGDRSVAMFDFAEGTHRVNIGEQIGSSGWSLVSVSQNEAVIRRNGDVRSIYIGQSF